MAVSFLTDFQKKRQKTSSHTKTIGVRAPVQKLDLGICKASSKFAANPSPHFSWSNTSLTFVPVEQV